MRGIFSKFIVVLALALPGAIPSATAQPGYLDPSFGGTGMILMGFGGTSDYGQTVAVQSDGQLLVAGYRDDAVANQFLVLRLGTNNLPDPTFGTDGLAAISPPYPAISVAAITEQPDGKILLAGSEDAPGSDGSIPAFLLMRLNSDGSLDTSFNDTGFASWSYSGINSTCYGMALQGDGKTVLVGTVSEENLNDNFSYMALVRFNANGNFDSSFGTSGSFVGSNYSSAYAVALRGDGDILAGGYKSGVGNGVFAFTTNGVPDTTFGSGGGVDISPADQITALAIQPPGIEVSQREMILAAGSGELNAVVARMSTGGVLDTTFGGTGYISMPLSTASPYITGLAPLISGSLFVRTIRILITGDFYNTPEYFAARFNNDGSMDTSFGNSGLVTTPITGSDSATANGFALLSGHIILTGARSINSGCVSDFVVARYNFSDGSLDTNFYGSGILETNFGNLAAQANSVAIQSDGKIVVAGYCATSCYQNVLALCRLNPDGSLDASFGSAGKLVTGIGSQGSRTTPVVIQPDGRIVVAGTATSGQNTSVMVARFLTNGTWDTFFGDGGAITNQIGTNSSAPNSIGLQTDGKILVAASASVGANDIAILRFKTNGTLDSAWNGTGQVLAAIGTSDTMAALAVQSDGKVINGGYSAFSGNGEFSMVRCNTNGSFDNTFGSFGRVGDSISGQLASGAYAMALQPDRKIILAGVTISSSEQQQVALMRFNTNGTLDLSFGAHGVVIASIGLGASAAFGVAVQNDGKIVAGCAAQIGPVYKFAAARFLTNGLLDAAYGVNGENYFDFGTDAAENISAIALDPLERMVLVGTAGNVFAVARVSGDPTLRFTSITASPGPEIFLTGLGIPGVSQTLGKANSLGASFLPLASITADASGNWQFEDTNAPAAPEGIYRLSYP